MRSVMRRAWGATALALALGACDPTVWDGLREQAPVLVVQGPGGVSGDFGRVLVAYEAEVRGVRVSRYGVSGGVDELGGSAYYALAAYDGLGGDARDRFSDGVLFRGCDEGECGEGHGRSIAAFPEWVAGDGTVFHGCIAAPSTSTGNVQIRCEDQLPNFQTISGPGGEDMGVSGAGIAWPQHRVGAAIFGAPAATGGDGALYRLPIGGGAPVRIDLSGASAPAGGRIGAAVAVAPTSERALLFATRADSMSGDDRVIVGTIDVDDAAVHTVTIRGCLEGPPGYGGALAIGDLDGDAMLDVVIGTAVDGMEQRIEVLDGAALPATAACGDATQPVPVSTIVCADVATEEVGCGDDGRIGLGASLAIGDVDADGTNDLIAGAPLASPEGRAAAGAVFVLAGQSGALGMLGIRSSVLYHSGQPDQNGLGAAVAAVSGPEGAEIVAGAPNDREVAIFFCSGLGDDVASEQRRGCLGAE